MTFLRLVFGTIFLALFGLYLHRYDQYHQFIYKISGDRLYIIDRKNHRVIEKDAKTFKVLLRGNEDFLMDVFLEPQQCEESSLPKSAPPRSALQTVGMIEPELSPAEVATNVFETTIFKDDPALIQSPASASNIAVSTPPESREQEHALPPSESSSAHILKNPIARELAQDVTKSAVSSIVSHEIGRHMQKSDNNNSDNNNN